MPSSASSIRSRSAWLLTSGCCVCGVGGAEGEEEAAAGWEEEEEVEGREEVLVSETAAPSLTGGTEDSGLKALEGAASVWRGEESSVNSMKLNYKKKKAINTRQCVCGFFFFFLPSPLSIRRA